MKKNKNSPNDIDQILREGSELGVEEKIKREFLSYFKKVENKLSFGVQLEKIYDLLVSGKLTGRDKVLVLGALVYFINPFDLIPDFTPFLGFADDLAVLAMAYRYLSNRAHEELDPTESKKPKDSNDRGGAQ